MVLLLTPFYTRGNLLLPRPPSPWPAQYLVAHVHVVPLQTPYPCCMTWGDISLPGGMYGYASFSNENHPYLN